MSPLSYFLIYILQIISVKSIELLIFHTNDINGYFDETFNSIGEKPVGGFPRIAYVLNKARDDYRRGKGPAVLYFDCGNVFIGSPWFSIHRDKIATALMNSLTPDAACLGTLEFAYGLKGLLPYLSKINFPIVVSNLGLSKQQSLAKLVNKKLVFNIKNTKIGILGYIKNRRQAFTNLIYSVEVLDEIEVIGQLAESLRKDGVHIIIVLSHGGLQADVTLSRLIRYVDIILGGNTRNFLWNGPPPDMEQPTDPYPLIVKRLDGVQLAIAHGYRRAKYLGKLHVSYNTRRLTGQYHGQPIFLNEDIGQDKYVADLLNTFRPAVTEANETFVGKSRVTLDGETCFYNECNFGNLIADSFVRYNAKRFLTKYDKISYNMWTDAAIGLINVGAIQESIIPRKRKNNVYKINLLEAIPFNNLLYVIKLSGSDLLLALEHGAKGHEHRRLPEFLIPSGLKVVYDFTRPEGKRVKSVLAKCSLCRTPKYEPLQSTSIYGVVTTEYLVNSGDGHFSLGKGKSNMLSSNDADHIINCLMEYFQAFQVVAPEIEGRIIIENPIPAGVPNSTVLDKCLYIIFISLIYCYK